MNIKNFINNKIINNKLKKIENENKRKPINTTNKKSTMKDFVIKVVGYINSYNSGREVLAESEYDLDEIKIASETDSYIKTSLDKYKRMIFKAGYYMKSENTKATEYLKQRFRIMSYATDKPIDILFQEMADDLITFSNCFLIKTRVKQIMPGIKANGLSDNGPIGGYSRVDPTTIRIKRDECGNIISYYQITIKGKEKVYKKEDVIHMYMNKDANNCFGTPKIIAAIEDVKLLRKLEGNVLAIIHRFAIPIFQWKIGKPEAGFQATDKEIEDAKYEIENMSLDGVVVTNEKTEIKVIGAEGAAINAAEYLNYFEQRVFSALDTSASQMGRGGAKQDATSMESQSHDYVKSVQKTLSIFIENYILNELLLEGGFNPILNENDVVQYIFNEISIDTKIKTENHELLKYQSNIQTIEEARRNMGYKDEVDTNRLYKNLIEVEAEKDIIKTTAEEQCKANIKLAQENSRLSKEEDCNSNTDSHSNTNTNSNSNTNDNKSRNISDISNGKKKDQTANDDVKTRNMPTNQHGTTSAKVNEKKDDNRLNNNKIKHKNKYKILYDKLYKMKENIIKTNSDIDYLMSLTYLSMSQDMKMFINNACKEGLSKAKHDLKKYKTNINNIESTNVSLQYFYDKSNKDIKNILEDIKEKIKDNRENSNVDKVIMTLEYRFRFMIEFIISKVKWYSYLKAGQKVGLKKAEIIFNSENDKNNHDRFIELNKFSLDQIPPFHPFCNCNIKFIR